MIWQRDFTLASLNAGSANTLVEHLGIEYTVFDPTLVIIQPILKISLLRLLSGCFLFLRQHRQRQPTGTKQMLFFIHQIDLPNLSRRTKM